MNQKHGRKNSPDGQHGCRLTVKVNPGSRESKIYGYEKGVLLVRIAAPPEKGKANRELVSLLSQRLGLSQSSISIAKGHTGRSKLISISGLGRDEVLARLLEQHEKDGGRDTP